MQTVDQVLQIIGEIAQPLPAEALPLHAAHGTVLAQDVAMDLDSPPFDRAQLDGFAVRAADFTGANLPGSLKLIGHIDAGATTQSPPIGLWECVGINTGAMLPPGADAILMVEHSETLPQAGDQTFIRPLQTVTPGYGIQKRGADATAGEVVLAAGSRLTPAALAVCATAGAATVRVRRLRAALLTTGDELVDPAQTPGPGQIRNSNHPMLRALLQHHAGDAPLLDLGSCGDDAPRLKNLLRQGLEESDLLIVSGGMSMGTRDLVPPLLRELGVEFHVEKVRIKPGKPLVIGSRLRQPGNGTRSFVAGLPGNPVSAFVTYQRFVRVLVGRLLGLPPADRLVEAEITASLAPNGDREFYQPCTLRRRGTTLLAEPLHWKGSADLFTLAKAQGLIIRPVSAPAAVAGATVPVLRF